MLRHKVQVVILSNSLRSAEIANLLDAVAYGAVCTPDSLTLCSLRSICNLQSAVSSLQSATSTSLLSINFNNPVSSFHPPHTYPLIPTHVRFELLDTSLRPVTADHSTLETTFVSTSLASIPHLAAFVRICIFPQSTPPPSARHPCKNPQRHLLLSFASSPRQYIVELHLRRLLDLLFRHQILVLILVKRLLPLPTISRVLDFYTLVSIFDQRPLVAINCYYNKPNHQGIDSPTLHSPSIDAHLHISCHLLTNRA